MGDAITTQLSGSKRRSETVTRGALKTDVHLCRAFLQVTPSVGVDLLDMCDDCVYMCDDCFFSAEFEEYEEGIFNHSLFLGGFHVFSILLGPMEIFFMHVVFGNTFLYGFSSCTNCT